jgi:ABC-type amino acid transport substrate-binding protein
MRARLSRGRAALVTIVREPHGDGSFVRRRDRDRGQAPTMRKERFMVRWLTLLGAMLILATPAVGADLEGTLKKIKSTGTINLGYRDSSRPFSFTGDDGKPSGYSVDLCNRIVTSIAKELAIPNLQAKWVKVTVADRMQLVANGTVDLECGSTTASLARQEQVDFSLLTFVDGGSLLVTDASGVRGVSTLGGKRVGIIPGTTTEKSLNDALKKHAVTVTLVPVKDHAEGVAALDKGLADAYASDRVILIGVGRTSKDPAKLSLVEEYFSYEPYGFMLRRNDSAFRLSVNRVLAGMYRSGDVVPIYEKWFGSMTTAGNLIGAMYLINGLPE